MVWYRKAADGGVAPAQFIVGNSLLQGTGVPKDEAAGIAWLKKAAAQNFPLALDDLGVMYVQGSAGLTKDPVQAAALFHKSASLGDPRGIGFLALSYATGTGVTQNIEAAYALFSLATIANFPNAAASRDKAAAMLTPDQIARARASIEGWRPGKPLPGDPAPATAH
jgi:TPR repeat protein